MSDFENGVCVYCGYANPKNEELQKWGWHCRGCQLKYELKWRFIEAVRGYLSNFPNPKYPSPGIARNMLANMKADDSLYLEATHDFCGVEWHIRANCPDFAQCLNLRLSLEEDHEKNQYLVGLWQAIDSISKMPITNVFAAAEYLACGLRYYAGYAKMAQEIESLCNATDKEIVDFVETSTKAYIRGYLE